ncbi:glycosyltransferase family 87 protein [Pseudarthrobacter sp. NPDC092439]|uniref:glycosyltransferase family 87 protein n=1 Tax=unclassified Pseudarthrobacter TaxID=2647000 RepID=UPI00382C4A4B
MDPGNQGAFLPDYLAHWTGGRLLLDGADNLYDPAVQSDLQGRQLGDEVPLAWFVSLPVVAALYAPLALIPYNLSGVLWFFLNAALLWWCFLSLRFLAPRLVQHRWKTLLLCALAAPPTFEALGSGQDSAFVLAVWLVGVRLFAHGCPGWAGAVLGLGFTKPQLVLVVPLVLLAVRSFKALAAFTLTVGAIAAASVALVGVAGIRQWSAALASPLYMAEVQEGQAWKMTGLPSLLQSLLPAEWGQAAAPVLTLISLPIGAAVLLAVLARHGKTADTTTVLIATLATSLAFSPHLATYDAVLFIPVAVFLLDRRPGPGLRVAILMAFVLMWLVAPLHAAAGTAPWLSALDAPWSALPLAMIWVTSLRALASRGPAGLR